ncbi:uncharacterized protein LOC134186915 isoform X2 [Corticium candelabrum]|uniref:uncharacterized protein LOC134186915 isoform X2 n=1 Tax=Corticium candelabrum TaxID=121492 RepID=UPI002E2549CC|nr:uncharacterized protein LOC134186915 isoform X2 [Corticium candelabrum]
MADLCSAVGENDIDKVADLLEAGADVNATNEQGRPLLLLATHKKYEEMAVFLLNKGALVNSTDAFQVAPIHYAAKENHPLTVTRLSAYLETVDISDANGRTPLWYAANNGHVKCVNILIILGGDPTRRSQEGMSPIDAAKENRHSEVARMMEDTMKSGILQYTTGTFISGTRFNRTENRVVITSAESQDPAVEGKAKEQKKEIFSYSSKDSKSPGLPRCRSLTVASAQTTGKEESNETAKMKLLLNIERQQNEGMKQVLQSLNKSIQQQKKLLDAAEEAEEERRAKDEQSKEILRIPSGNIKFVEEDKLGQGSFGEVVVAEWQGSTVAVKKVYDFLTQDQENIKRQVDFFLQEVSVAWKIHHPNIVPVYGFCLETNGKTTLAWLVMELLQCSLGDVLKINYSQLTLREKVDIGRDCLCALNYLHSLMKPNVILHGDLRPTNILIAINMTAKLGDLGAARLEDAQLSVGLMSPQHTAPERMREDGSTAHKTTMTDIYSMGVTLCELFTGVSANREYRKDHVQKIKERNIRSQCIDMVKDNPKERPTADKVLTALLEVVQTKDYKKCGPRKMVKMGKGKPDEPKRPILTDCN